MNSERNIAGYGRRVGGCIFPILLILGLLLLGVSCVAERIRGVPATEFVGGPPDVFAVPTIPIETIAAPTPSPIPNIGATPAPATLELTVVAVPTQMPVPDVVPNQTDTPPEPTPESTLGIIATATADDRSYGYGPTLVLTETTCDPNIPPLPALSHPNPVMIGQGSATVIFDAGNAIDVDGLIVEYVWDFGDGTALVSRPEPTTRHDYDGTTGRYEVTLTVVDDCGATASVMSEISVVEPPPPTVTPETTPQGENPTPTPTGVTPQPQEPIGPPDSDGGDSETPTPLPTLYAQASRPESMRVDASDIVDLSLTTLDAPLISPAALTTMATPTPPLSAVDQVSTWIFPDATPGPRETFPATPEVIDFARLCGVPAGYHGFAIATLDGSAFDISPQGPQRKALSKLNSSQSTVTWLWTISPKRAGTHKVILNLEIDWFPPSGRSGSPIYCDIWKNLVRDIEVDDPPLFARGQLDAVGLGMTVIGGIGSFFWERIQTGLVVRRKREREE